MTNTEPITVDESKVASVTEIDTKRKDKAPRKRPSRSKVPEGFTVVEATDKEVERYRKSRPNATPETTRRLKCRSCNGRIWESGVGLRAHRRTCKGHPEKNEG